MGGLGRELIVNYALRVLPIVGRPNAERRIGEITNSFLGAGQTVLTVLQIMTALLVTRFVGIDSE